MNSQVLIEAVEPTKNLVIRLDSGPQAVLNPIAPELLWEQAELREDDFETEFIQIFGEANKKHYSTYSTTGAGQSIE